MDRAALSSDSVLETLLKTNRPPTDEEKTIIQESMAPTNAKLKAVEEEISDTISHIQALKSQVERAERKLQRLRAQEAAIWKTSKDHRRVLSAVRNLPEDVLREICVACVADCIPPLFNNQIPLPYVLAQISSEMRHIALTTPIIWTRMDARPHFMSSRLAYSALARKAFIWFERARGLPLTLFIEDPTFSHTSSEASESDQSDIFFDSLLRYATQWEKIKFTSDCHYLSRPIIRIASLTAIDLPLLESVSLDLGCSISLSSLTDSAFLMVPTLKDISLLTNDLRSLSINWEGLTSIYLNAKWDISCYSMNELAGILQQTKCLIHCDIAFSGWNSAGVELNIEEITLPFLETLRINDRTFGPLPPSSGTPSLIDLITAPVLEILDVGSIFVKFAFSEFLQRSPKIWKLSLPYFPEDTLFTNTIGFLRHCPSLTVLSLQPPTWGHGSNTSTVPNADILLQTFIDTSDVGVVCPLLQYITFHGEIDFSHHALQLFLNRKHGETAMPNILPWKRVIIDIRGIMGTEKRRQILDFISQKKAQGLNVATTKYS